MIENIYYSISMLFPELYAFKISKRENASSLKHVCERELFAISRQGEKAFIHLKQRNGQSRSNDPCKNIHTSLAFSSLSLPYFSHLSSFIIKPPALSLVTLHAHLFAVFFFLHLHQSLYKFFVIVWICFML